MNIRFCIFVSVKGLSIPTKTSKLIHKDFPWNNSELPKKGSTLYFSYVTADGLVTHRISISSGPEYIASCGLTGPWIMSKPRVFGTAYFDDTNSVDVFETELLNRGFEFSLSSSFDPA